MEHIRSIQKKCTICGEISEQKECEGLHLQNLYDLDLDLRPSYMIGDVLYNQVQQCPSCGFCAPDLSYSYPGMEEILRPGVCQVFLDNTTIPIVLRRFHAWSYCARRTENMKEAFFTAMKASWIGEEIRENRLASEWRNQAISFMHECRERGDCIWDIPGFFELVLANLYRRTAAFDEGKEIVMQGLSKISDPLLVAAFLYLDSLLNRWDTLHYSFQDIPCIQQRER